MRLVNIINLYRSLGVLTILFCSLPLNAASYDCALSSLTSIEKEICNDSELSKFDDEISLLYKKVKYFNKKFSKKSQRKWIKKRNSCSGKGLNDCLSQSYRQRIVDMNNLLLRYTNGHSWNITSLGKYASYIEGDKWFDGNFGRRDPFFDGREYVRRLAGLLENINLSNIRLKHSTLSCFAFQKGYYELFEYAIKKGNFFNCQGVYEIDYGPLKEYNPSEIKRYLEIFEDNFKPEHFPDKLIHEYAQNLIAISVNAKAEYHLENRKLIVDKLFELANQGFITKFYPQKTVNSIDDYYTLLMGMKTIPFYLDYVDISSRRAALKNALYISSYRGNNKELNWLLLNYEFSVDEKIYSYSSGIEHDDIIRSYELDGVNTKTIDAEGRSALFYAVVNSRQPSTHIEKLINKGADINLIVKGDDLATHLIMSIDNQYWTNYALSSGKMLSLINSGIEIKQETIHQAVKLDSKMCKRSNGHPVGLLTKILHPYIGGESERNELLSMAKDCNTIVEFLK